MDPRGRMPGSQDLIEEALTARREIAPDGAILPHAAWADLDQEARQALFEETARSRTLEAALDRKGHSGTVKAVLGRIQGQGRP